MYFTIRCCLLDALPCLSLVGHMTGPARLACLHGGCITSPAQQAHSNDSMYVVPRTRISQGIPQLPLGARLFGDHDDSGHSNSYQL